MARGGVGPARKREPGPSARRATVTGEVAFDRSLVEALGGVGPAHQGVRLDDVLNLHRRGDTGPDDMNATTGRERLAHVLGEALLEQVAVAVRSSSATSR